MGTILKLSYFIKFFVEHLLYGQKLLVGWVGGFYLVGWMIGYFRVNPWHFKNGASREIEDVLAEDGQVG